MRSTASTGTFARSAKTRSAVVPRDEYGLGKLLCTELARGRRKIVNLRLFGVYGRHEKYLFKFISNTIVKVLLREDIVIRQDVLFDYLYVEDLAAIVAGLLERDSPYSDVNVTPSRSIRLSEIVSSFNGSRSGVSP